MLTVSVASKSRGRSDLSAAEGGDAAGADVQPVDVVSGGNGEPGWRAAGQCSANSVRHGGNAAPQTEVTLYFSSY